MTDTFLEYGRVTFRGKRVVVGVEEEDGVEFNAAYFLNKDGSLKPINRKTAEGQVLTFVFNLGMPSLDLDAAKRDSKIIDAANQGKMEDIDIADYMPKNISKEQYIIIHEMLSRLQDTFPYAPSDNLKLRLPSLIVEDTKARDEFMDGFFRPRTNYLGLCKNKISSVDGMAATIHELSHMISARAKLNGDGTVTYEENVGFGDKNHNGLAITEGFNELFSSLARCAEPRSYEIETSMVTLLYVMNRNPYSLARDFYAGDQARIMDFGEDELSAKKLVKNFDYNSSIYYYNLNQYYKAYKQTEDKVIREMTLGKASNLQGFKLSDGERELISKIVKENFNKVYKYDFSESNFLPNMQDGLLDLYHDFLKGNGGEEVKQIATDALFTAFIFPDDMSESAKKYIDEKEIEKNEEKFISILLDCGLSEEDIVQLYIDDKANAVYLTGDEVAFDDKHIEEATEIAKEKYRNNKARFEASYEEENEDDFEDEDEI